MWLPCSLVNRQCGGTPSGHCKALATAALEALKASEGVEPCCLHLMASATSCMTGRVITMRLLQTVGLSGDTRKISYRGSDNEIDKPLRARRYNQCQCRSDFISVAARAGGGEQGAAGGARRGLPSHAPADRCGRPTPNPARARSWCMPVQGDSCVINQAHVVRSSCVPPSV